MQKLIGVIVTTFVALMLVLPVVAATDLVAELAALLESRVR
jgi:hypothetical protein